MLRDTDDVRKVNGKFTTGWMIVQVVSMVLFTTLLIGIFWGNMWLVWGSAITLFVIAAIARIVRGRLRKQQRILRGMDPDAVHLHFTAEEVEAMKKPAPTTGKRLPRR